MNEQPEITGENRNPDGTFKKGVSGNPNGRPKDSFSLVAMLKKKLQELEPINKKTYAELFINNIVNLAILDKNDSQIKNIMQYVEGMPKQVIKNEYDDEVTEVKISVKK